VATPDDLYAVVAGDPGASSLGDGGSALDAALHVTDVDVGPDGSIYVAGGGPATEATLTDVQRIAVAPDGGLYIASWANADQTGYEWFNAPAPPLREPGRHHLHDRRQRFVRFPGLQWQRSLSYRLTHFVVMCAGLVSLWGGWGPPPFQGRTVGLLAAELGGDVRCSDGIVWWRGT
jgi:hypothetical protein